MVSAFNETTKMSQESRKKIVLIISAFIFFIIFGSSIFFISSRTRSIENKPIKINNGSEPSTSKPPEPKHSKPPEPSAPPAPRAVKFVHFGENKYYPASDTEEEEEKKQVPLYHH